MSKRLPALHAKQCKKFAEDCLIWAKTARSETERTVFYMARTCTLAAADSKHSNVRPRRRAQRTA